GRLLVVPKVAARELPEGYLDRARQQGTVVVEAAAQRAKLVDELLRALSSAQPGSASPNVALPLADDFLALGFCYLHTEALTRRMPYARHLDEKRFQESALSAGCAWAAGDEAQTKVELADCFAAL